ncbi:methyl-accepting chemotaxis protein [Natronorubrum halalkaliphilum]|uniref:methyl-accepting chemotaxis protein n=1 Tax=Natronorubrum halalkaliphilum TaxID=2691917 RepID=UPI001914DE67|nr:methyl-accepting chemotaxis protein [Natronorubrum halalkaliphilum]
MRTGRAAGAVAVGDVHKSLACYRASQTGDSLNGREFGNDFPSTTVCQSAVETRSEAHHQQLEAHAEKREAVRSDLEESLDDLATVANRIKDGTGEISEVADEQSASVAEIASELSDLGPTVEEIASNTEEVSATTEHAAETAVVRRTDNLLASAPRLRLQSRRRLRHSPPRTRRATRCSPTSLGWTNDRQSLVTSRISPH